MALRISKAERAELARLKKNYNAKIRRLTKKGVDVASLPVVDFTNVNTRKELNLQKETAKSFLNRANLKYQYVYGSGQPVSKKQALEFEVLQKRANRLIGEKEKLLNTPKLLISEHKQNIPNTSALIKPRQLPKFKRTVDDFSTEKDLQYYIDLLNRSIQANQSLHYEEIFMDNMKTALVKVFGDKGDELGEKIDKMGVENVMRMYYLTDIFNIEFIYGTTDFERKLAYTEYMIDFYADIIQ